MSNKKKKPARKTPAQKLRACFTNSADAVRAFGTAAAGRLRAGNKSFYGKLSAFIALPWSAAPLAVLMFGLTMLTYFVNGKLYLTGSVFMYFPSTVTYHLFDYSVGFISRAFVGSVISLFADTVTVKLVLTLSRITVFTLFVLQSGVAALVFKKAFLKKNLLFCAAALAFVTGPVTVLSFVYNLGLLDQYYLVLALLFLYAADTKAGAVLTPVLCTLGLLIHQAFAYTLLPAVVLILLYYICAEPRLRKARIVSLAVTVCVCGALAVYFLFFEKYRLKMTEPELDAYLAGKFKEAETFGVYKDYYTFYLFGKDASGAYAGAFDKIRRLIELTFSNIQPVNEVRLLVVLLPFYALLEYCWSFSFRRARKGGRLPYLGFMLLPLLRIGTFLISDDMLRFADEACLANFMLLAAVVKKDDAYVNGAVQTLQKRLDRPWKRCAAAALTLTYLITAVLLYTVFLH